MDTQTTLDVRQRVKAGKKRLAILNAALQKPKADVYTIALQIISEASGLLQHQSHLNACLNSTTETAVVAKLAKRRNRKAAKPVAAMIVDVWRACSRCCHPKASHHNHKHGCSHVYEDDDGLTAGCACDEYRP